VRAGGRSEEVGHAVRMFKGWDMHEQFSLEVFITMPWGDGPEAIPEVLEDYPAFGEMSPEQMRGVHAPVRIRLDSAGGLHALADAPTRAGGDAFASLQPRAERRGSHITPWPQTGASICSNRSSREARAQERIGCAS
jgi:hypothetical protein